MITADRLHSVQEYYFSKKLREVRGLMLMHSLASSQGFLTPALNSLLQRE